VKFTPLVTRGEGNGFRIEQRDGPKQSLCQLFVITIREAPLAFRAQLSPANMAAIGQVNWQVVQRPEPACPGKSARPNAPLNDRAFRQVRSCWGFLESVMRSSGAPVPIADSVSIATGHDNRFGCHFLAQRSPRLAGAMRLARQEKNDFRKSYQNNGGKHD
jgi:hypothetical protein